ncbi:MAG: sulfotransferase [Cyanobacteria bacterium P01_D01_bin.128]
MLPNLVIIGAMKCGTTSLHHYLSLHPEISMSKQKELDFFIEKKNWKKGLQWYKDQFLPKSGAKIFGEASPNYTNSLYFPGAAEKMHSVIPNAKLIYLVRDPIERMIAHYIHMYSCGHESKSIDRALTKAERNVYLICSSYYTQICYFLDYFDISQILIIPSEDLRKNTSETLKRIFQFLDVDVSFESWQFAYQHHKSTRKRRKTSRGKAIASSRLMKRLSQIPQPIRSPIEEILYLPFSESINRPKISESTRVHIKNCLAEDIERFRGLTTCEFPAWSV